MISVINNRYVIQLPEFGVYQDVDPSTGEPFASEGDAQKWADDFIACIQAQQSEVAAREQRRLAATLHLDVTADKTRAALGDTVTITAVVKNALGDVVPMNDDFAVPVEDETGKVVLIKLATFSSGHASVDFQPGKSGYFVITEEGINRRMPGGLHFGLPAPVWITVFE